MIYYPADTIYRTTCDFQCHKTNYPQNLPGIDWAFPKGTQVLNALEGKVIFAKEGYNDGFGNLVKVSSPGGYEIWYAHLKSIKVVYGQEIPVGYMIGQADATGYTDPPGASHLHFGVKKNGTWVDPEKHMFIPYQTPPDYTPPGEVIYGIDVSHHNAVNMKKASEQGIKFCYVKITEGTSWVDDKADAYYNECKKYGIKVGFYHYWNAGVNGEAQADHMLTTIGDRELDMPVALDCEDPRAPAYSEQVNSKSIYDFAKLCQGWDGWPEICAYTRASWWNPNVNTKYEWWRLGLWVAHWGAGGNPAIPSNWKEKKVPYTIHQYGTIQIGNQRIDGNKWNNYYEFPPQRPLSPSLSPSPSPSPSPSSPLGYPASIYVEIDGIMYSGVTILEKE